jgi:outer membrane lipoprotein SlyB
MPNKLTAVLSATLAIALVGCASTEPVAQSTNSMSNASIAVQYGRIENIEQVALAPDYGAGALVGGALGLLATANRSGASQVAGVAAGAGLGALIAQEAAGSAEKFTVRLISNSTIDIVSEIQDLALGDCVSIEQGQHANIRRVSSVMCLTSPSDPAYQPMNNSVVAESAQCLQAKQELMNATTMEQTDIGYKKMRAFCES